MRRASFTTPLLLLALGAALARPGSAQADGPQPAVARAALLAPEGIRQGDPLLVWLLTDADAEGAEALLLAASGRRVAAAAAFAGPPLPLPPLVGETPAFRAYGFLLGAAADLQPGAYRVEVALPPGAAPAASVLAARVELKERAFPQEDIPLDAENTRLRTAPSARKQEEARRLYALLGRADRGEVHLDGSPFMLPLVPLWKSAGFGDRRRYLYEGGGIEGSVHAGLDLAVATGTQVLCCSPGRVVMAADREVTGFTVVVEHLPGLYSLYMHLSSIAVAEGQAVDRGDLLGLSGSTGMSTGPHLHWELRARGQAVDPEYWLSRPPLDKDRAAAIIAGLIEGR